MNAHVMTGSRSGLLVRAVVVLTGLPTVLLGLWAFFAPALFVEFFDFPPNNAHLAHDVGAFQIGLGVAVLLTLLWSDAALVVLTGLAVGSAFHLAAHVLDADLGGSLWQTTGIALLTALAVGGALARARSS